jgi:hypothetical protein
MKKLFKTSKVVYLISKKYKLIKINNKNLLILNHHKERKLKYYNKAL